MAGSKERALNFAVRVAGVSEAAAAFAKVKAAAGGTVDAVAKAGTAAGAHEAALSRSMQTATAYGAAQGELAAKSKQLAADLKSGAITAEQHAVALQTARNAVSVLAVDQRLATAAVKSTRAELISAQQAAAAYANDNQAAAGAVRQFSQASLALRASLDPAVAAQARFIDQVRVAKTAFREGAISIDQYVGVVRQAQIERSLGGVATSSRAARAGMQQLGYQLGDFATQVGSGTSVAQAFAQQIGQTAQAVQLMSGGTSKFATFMGGGWGIALTVGVTALAGLANMLLRSEDTADSAKDAHIDLSNALGRQKAAHEDLRKAIDDYNRSQEKSTENTRLYTKQALAAGQADLERAKAKRELLDAELKLQEAALGRDAPFLGGPEELSAYQAGVSQGVLSIQGKIKENDADIVRLQTEINNRTLQMGEFAARALDPIEKIRQRWADALKVVRDGTRDGLFRGVPADQVVVAIAAKQRAQEEAAQQAQRLLRGTGTAETTDFILPVSGRTTGSFGENRGARNHAGLDIAVPVGTAVKAPAGGVVIEAGTVPGYGNVVYIDHGAGTITRLAHLSSIGVSKGAQVGQGDVVGLSGGAKGAPGSGNSEGPHVHYEVRRNGKSVDPRTGSFPVDGLGAAGRGTRLADRTEEEQERRDRAYAQEAARIAAAILQSRRSLMTDSEQLAALAREQLQTEAVSFAASIDAQVKRGELDAAKAEELKISNAINLALQTQKLELDEQARKASEALGQQIAANDNARDILQLQSQLADTTSDRRKIARALLDLDKENERLKLLEIISQGKTSEAAAKRAAEAERQLASLDQRYGLKGQLLDRSAPTSLERFISDTSPGGIEDQVNDLVTDQLLSVRRGINSAITDALGVEDPLISGLIQILLDQLLFRPIAQALQGGISGGGGLGSFLGGLFGGGGLASAASRLAPDVISNIAANPALFASGTPAVPTGRAFHVGENGRETMRYHGGGRLEVISGPRAHREAANSNSIVVNSTYIVPERGDSRATRSAVARGQQLAIGRAMRKGLA